MKRKMIEDDMVFLNEKAVDEILRHYLWCGVDLTTGVSKYDIDDVTKDSVAKAREDVEAFVEKIKDLDIPEEISNDKLGHNFWLTRNGHGSGFWDRGWGEIGDRLSEISNEFGEANMLEAGNNRHLHYESY